jgi:transposase
MQKSRLRLGWVKKYEEITNKKGMTWSEDGNKACFLYIYHRLLEETEVKQKGKEIDYYGTYSVILNECESIFSRRRKDLKDLFEYYELNDIVLTNIDLTRILKEESKIQQKEKKQEQKSIYQSVTQEMIIDIEKIILEANRSVNSAESKPLQCGATTTMIRRYLQEKYKTDIEKRKLLLLLHNLGYEWGKLKYNGLTLNTDKKGRVRKYLYEFSLALKQEQQGDAIIVYTDETYVNTRHQFDYSWYNKEKPETTVLAKRIAPWCRYIVLHAISKDGLIKTQDENKQDIHIDEKMANDLQEEQGQVLTAEKVWVSDKDKGDYHKNVTNKLFMEWVNNRLIPTFRKMYGDKMKMILIMDNAGAHNAIDANKIIPKKMKKEELYKELKKRNVKTVEVQRIRKKSDNSSNKQKSSSDINASDQMNDNNTEDTLTNEATAIQTLLLLQVPILKDEGEVQLETIHLPIENWNRRKEEVKISKEEMAEQLERELVKNNESYDERSLIEEQFDKVGWQIIWTPPSQPVFQPIELVWAYTKHYVKRRYHTKRDEKELLQHIRESLDGNKEQNHEGVSKETCEKLLSHVKKICDVYIQNDDKLEGCIDNLTCKDVDVLNSIINDDRDAFTYDKNEELDEIEME